MPNKAKKISGNIIKKLADKDFHKFAVENGKADKGLYDMIVIFNNWIQTKEGKKFLKAHLKYESENEKSDEESEDEKKKEDFDEDGFCNSCGWNSCFPNSHIEYSYGVCEYIKKKYGEIGLKDVFEDDEFERPLLTDKKESEDYEYVIKTYDNRNEYLGLFEVSNGNKSWNTEFQARIVFNVAIQLVELGTLILVRIDANSNEDRETIIEKKGRDRIDRY